MEESENLDSEMTELQEFQDEDLSQDYEDEMEELQNSLREVVQDPSVKPKLQCLMVDPSFSMVTVQSEDSGIVWETASSRCSTPWASEASSTSEAYSMEGSGGAGKITIVFDEDKIVRRRTRSGGRSSRLGDRLSRPGSSRSASALGVERPEMADVSLPNIKEEKKATEPDLEEIKSKDQQLFSLISEGYEILNIRVPSKLPTVDEEETTDLQDNLSYLDQTPKIRSRSHHGWSHHGDQVEADQIPDQPESSTDTSQPLPEKKHEPTTSETESTADIDYIEKFTLLDVVIHREKVPQPQPGEEMLSVKAQTEEQEASKEATEDVASVSEDSFVFVTDSEIVGEHLDEVFYGEGPPIESLKQKEEGTERMRSRRESQRSVKDRGLVLFESEQTTLTPIFISSGPPKIIDPILLEEPTAMSFMYSDLYEDAVGEKRRSDEEYSEAESVASEKSYKRRLSDSDEADGYLEKFRLKDETPAVGLQSESVEDTAGGRMVWAQSKFEMTGCLLRAAENNEEEMEITKNSEEDTDDMPEMIKEKQELQTETEESHSSVMDHDGASEDILEESHQEFKLADHMETKQEQQALEPSAETFVESNEIVPEKHIKTEILFETQRETEKMSEQLHVKPDTTASTLPEGREDPPACTEHTPKETTGLSKDEAPVESKMVTADVKSPPEAEAKVKETGDATLSSLEPVTESKAASIPSLHEDKEAECPLKPDTDCESTLEAMEELMEKVGNEEDIQTQVRTDIQEVKEVILLVPDTKEHHEHIMEDSSEENKAEAAGMELDVKTETSQEITQPAEPKEISLEPNNKHQKQTETPACDSDSLNQTSEPTATMSAEDIETCVQDVVNVGDELILLVPKGQAVEMDIQIDQGSEDIIKGTLEPEILSEVQGPEPQVEEEPIVIEQEKELTSKEFELRPLSDAPEEEASTEDKEAHKDNLILSQLRSFTPQENLAELCQDEVHAEQLDEKTEIQDMEGKTEINLLIDDAMTSLDLHSEDVEQIKEQSPTVLETKEESVDDLGYEVIGEEDTTGMRESKIEREVEEGESCQRPEEKMETQVETDELDEADYEIIDAEEESQARLAAELQGMDWFCTICGCLLSEDENRSAEHQGHEVCLVENAYEDIKETLSSWISELQARSENIEDLVSELELAYSSVEDQFADSEAAMREQNEEMMALVMEQYNTMSISMEEEKKAKLEQLYDKIVSYQENIDSAKSTLETTAREAETDASTPEEIHARLETALDSVTTLELGPKGLLVFEDYAKTNPSSSNMAQREGIPVPQSPTLQPQELGSASSTSVTVYWKISPGDNIDCFQVYCVEDPQEAVSEEYRVTVKESYCVLEELESDKMYKLWVMAVNYTGCSLPSERLIFRTAPSVPMIDTKRSSVMWDSATLRWSSAKPGLSYTLEYCRKYELEGEGLRSISGIKRCEQKVVLQPNENYLFYIKAVNEAGASEQSEAALVSTKGTRFQLLKSSAHPALKLSDDLSTLLYSQEAQHVNTQECPSILGELLPPRGLHYWEAVVSESPAYRLGVTCSMDDLSGLLGENTSSWCLQCTGPLGCRYQLLHNNVQTSVTVTETPEVVGVLLNHQLGRLSFYNASSGQSLGFFAWHCSRPCCPALGLEQQGSMKVRMVPEMPEFTRDS